MESRCDNTYCPCNMPRAFWVELDSDGNPINICWAYYKDDRPIKGNWIKVEETGDKNA